MTGDVNHAELHEVGAKMNSSSTSSDQLVRLQQCASSLPKDQVNELPAFSGSSIDPCVLGCDSVLETANCFQGMPSGPSSDSNPNKSTAHTWSHLQPLR
jgi:hypothetical protein